MLTSRWTPLNFHPEQNRLKNISKARFRVVPAGRRSGKTELAKRFLVEKALEFTAFPDGLFVAAAPTHLQAKRIYWPALKALVPKKGIVGKPSETELTITLITGTRIMVAGLDKPERIEGLPIDGIILDEYGNMKEATWGEHIRPALSTPGRLGWAWFIGVPEGRNHYYQTYQKALEPTSNGWDGFHWISADILDPEEIEAAKAELDELTYMQEYEASFIYLEGRVYYPFDRKVHASETIQYDPTKDLHFIFDFNQAPGVAAVAQELTYTGNRQKLVSEAYTGVIGEVWIPKNSRTPFVCKKLIQDWAHHKGDVYCYGDSTGGAGGSAKTEGSDWDQVRKYLGNEFGERLTFSVPRGNPPENHRVNTLNSRLMSMDGKVHLLIDPIKAPHMVEDLEGVVTLKGGSGEIDKKINLTLTHMSDGLGYYTHRKFPTTSRELTIKSVYD